MLLYLRLLKESFIFAMHALTTNKLRTILSLLGVTIGIFSIIAVLSAIDSLDQKISKDLGTLDKNTIYLVRFSFGPTEIPEWKVDQFPNMKYDEFTFLQKNIGQTEAAGFQVFTDRETLKNEDKTVSDVGIMAVSYEFETIQGYEITQGRFYNESESNSGSAVVVLGHDIAQSLFENTNPIGKNIRMYGKRFTVIGVLKKQGASLFDDSNDGAVCVPANFIRQLYGNNNKYLTTAVVFKPQKNVDIDAYKAEIIQKLRTYRGLKQGEIDNFFINILSGFTSFIDGIIGQMNVMGWIISGFSLLVGGFGIANIMFVSVKERTNLIGIQKSLGAKNKFILFQFLFEAIILSVLGGIIGLLLVWGIGTIVSKTIDFEIVISTKNMFLGAGLASVIGLISGILPAISASKLDPVEAIRSGM